MVVGTLKFGSTREDVRTHTLWAVKQLGWKILDDGSISGLVRARTGASLLSWGSNVAARLVDLPDGAVRVMIEAEPAAQAIDWGQGARHVNELGNLLMQRGGRLE